MVRETFPRVVNPAHHLLPLSCNSRTKTVIIQARVILAQAMLNVQLVAATPLVVNLNRGDRMNNETSSAGFKTETPPLIEPARSFVPTADSRRTIVRWLRRLLACNPFYLVSAALLLFGMYHVSLDPRFLQSEVARLRFNFSSLQLYEALLVGVAIVLAGRAIWYDAAGDSSNCYRSPPLCWRFGGPGDSCSENGCRSLCRWRRCWS